MLGCLREGGVGWGGEGLGKQAHTWVPNVRQLLPLMLMVRDGNSIGSVLLLSRYSRIYVVILALHSCEIDANLI